MYRMPCKTENLEETNLQMMLLLDSKNNTTTSFMAPHKTGTTNTTANLICLPSEFCSENVWETSSAFSSGALWLALDESGEGVGVDGDGV